MKLEAIFKQNPFIGPHTPETRLFFFICFGAGALLDFIFCGVLKIIWIVVYGPAYVAAGAGLMNALETTRWSKVAYPASLFLILGALFLHVCAVGYSRALSYRVAWTSNQPMTFASPEWPQRLIVTSVPLAAKLAAVGPPSTNSVNPAIEVVVLETLDYGCIRSFRVDTVDGVDVRLDPNATWVWKLDKTLELPPAGPGQEDRSLPWCLFKFYR